jgi:hypothetical protein
MGTIRTKQLRYLWSPEMKRRDEKEEKAWKRAKIQGSSTPWEFYVRGDLMEMALGVGYFPSDNFEWYRMVACKISCWIGSGISKDLINRVGVKMLAKYKNQRFRYKRVVRALQLYGYCKDMTHDQISNFTYGKRSNLGKRLHAFSVSGVIDGKE